MTRLLSLLCAVIGWSWFPYTDAAGRSYLWFGPASRTAPIIKVRLDRYVAKAQ